MVCVGKNVWKGSLKVTTRESDRKAVFVPRYREVSSVANGIRQAERHLVVLIDVLRGRTCTVYTFVL